LLRNDQLNGTVADEEGNFLVSGEELELHWISPTIEAMSACDVLQISPLGTVSALPVTRY
jgi:hypothetical protein